LRRRRLEGGDALGRIGIEIEAAAFETEVDRTPTRRRHGERTLAGFAIEFEVAVGETKTLRGETESRLQLEAAPAARPQRRNAIPQARPQPQGEFAQVTGLKAEIAREFAAARSGEVAALEQHLAAPRKARREPVDGKPVPFGGNRQRDVVEGLALALQRRDLDAAVEAHVLRQERQQAIEDGETARLAEHVA